MLKRKFAGVSASTLIVLGIGLMSIPIVDADSSSFAGGDGTSASPFVIDTASQLQLMAQYVNDGDNDPGGNPYASDDYELDANINLSSSGEWTPIGTSTTPFAGTFDGQNHHIVGLSVSDSTLTYTGLFGVTEGTIENVSVLGSVTNGGAAGILAGQQQGSGNIINAHVGGSVTSTDGNYVGGLLGHLSEGSVTTSSSTAAVNSTWGNAGGLVGYQNGGTISESFSIGNVTGFEEPVGGLDGEKDSGEIENCYSTSSVVGTSSVGGLVGFSEGEISDSYSIGNVTATGSNVGGLIGNWRSGSLSDLFWDEDTSNVGDGIGNASNDDVTGLSDQDMKATDPYDANWSSTIWSFQNGEYPTLINNQLVLSSPPTLVADTTDNDTTHAIDITYTDDPAWDSAIGEIEVDGAPLPGSEYTVSSGQIEIDAGVLSTGSHDITVKAINYSDATVTQEIIDVASPPTLTSSTTNNDTAHAIDITYADDSAWDSAITEVDVDGAPLSSSDYTLSPGQIEIDAGVLSAGDRTITVKASGYSDATVVQQISTASGLSMQTSSTVVPVGQNVTVTGSVYSLQGDTQNPLADSPVTLSANGGSWVSDGQSTNSTVYSVYTGDQGTFSMDWSGPDTPGVYTLSASSNGQTASTDVDVTKFITGAVTAQPFLTSTSSPVTETFSNLANPGQSSSNVQLTIPAGTFAQDTPIWVTSTSDASQITPSGQQDVAAIGVNFSGTPTQTMMLTIQNPNIAPGDAVYKILPDGTYQQLPADDVTITSGQATISFSTDPNFVVTRPAGGATQNPPSIQTFEFTEPGQEGKTYSAHIAEMGGTAPLTWAVVAGSLPPGLSLDNQGNITGTPTSAGTYTFTVKVTDAVHLSATKQLTLTVDGSTSGSSGGSTGAGEGGATDEGGSGSTASGSSAPQLTITTPTVVTPGTLGQPFEQTLSATGGTAPYTWSILDGVLLSGLQLNSAGSIIGTTAEEKPAIVTVEAKDANGATQQKQIVVDAVPSNEREIVWELPDLHAENVPAIVGNDGGTQTTYMPIWYVMQVMNTLGIKSTWNGHEWNLTTSGPTGLSNIQPGTGSTSIYLNGTLVQQVNTEAQVDPSSNKLTTYMPIWYVEQILNRVGLVSTWNGTTWTLTQANN